MGNLLRVLFYSDAPSFGGHEVQTLALVRHLASQADTQVGFIYFRGNLRLAQQINELAALFPLFKPLPQDYASRQFQFLRTLVSGRSIRRMAATMTAFAPDVVVLVQGAIAFGSAGLVAAKKAGAPVISYIPMTHPERMFSASRLRAALREPVNRRYYRMVDAYITISPRMQAYLRQKGLDQPVTVVPPALELANLSLVDKNEARASLGLAADDWVIATIGRVEFWQKRQDLAVEGLALARRQVPQLKLLVVGDGPDLPALKERVRAAGMQDAVVFVGWVNDLAPVYSAMDALVMPSRFEGIPVVMIEALYHRRPVIGSAVDGMLDHLPPQWLFPSGDVGAFAARLVQAAGANQRELLEEQREKAICTFSLPVVEKAFRTAVLAAATWRRPGANT